MTIDNFYVTVYNPGEKINDLSHNYKDNIYERNSSISDAGLLRKFFMQNGKMSFCLLYRLADIGFNDKLFQTFGSGMPKRPQTET